MPATLLTGSVDLDTMERYFTVEDLALIVGESPKWISKQRDAGIIAPALFKGRQQYGRGAILRLEAFKGLQEEFGHNSAMPALIVREAGPKLDELGRRQPNVYTVDALNALSDAVVAAIWTPEVQAELGRRFGALAK